MCRIRHKRCGWHYQQFPIRSLLTTGPRLPKSTYNQSVSILRETHPNERFGVRQKACIGYAKRILPDHSYTLGASAMIQLDRKDLLTALSGAMIAAIATAALFFVSRTAETLAFNEALKDAQHDLREITIMSVDATRNSDKIKL